MANTLPGTPYVESSDLVANYPAVSESLAERIDEVGVLPFADSTARGTALPTPSEGQYSYLEDTNATEYWDGAAWVAAGVAPGLVHINTTTFSAVSSVNVNDVFTSTYENYLIMVNNLTTASGDNGLEFRLRASGSDATAANYDYQNFTATSSTVATALNSNQTLIRTAIARTGVSATSFNIFRPQIAAPTVLSCLPIYDSDSGAGLRMFAGKHTLSTSYDGFTLFPAASTITGTVRVYGYKNS